jgi:hypothetical protein
VKGIRSTDFRDDIFQITCNGQMGKLSHRICPLSHFRLPKPTWQGWGNLS